MIIKSLSYADKASKWEIEHVDFLNLTLLVGASGVGKTQILKSLQNLKNIALGENIKRLKWLVDFEERGVNYRWQGESDYPTNTDNFLFSELLSDIKSVVTFEKLTKITENNEEKVIFFRNNDVVTINGNEVSNLTQTKSCINLFSKERDIENLIKGFQKMFFFEFEIERKFFLPEIPKHIEEDIHLVFDVIKEGNYPSLFKLYIIYKYFPAKFKEIKGLFIDIFPFVTDIRYNNVQSNNSDKSDEKSGEYELQIKEENSEWVHQRDISSGMLKTLLYISTLQLIPEESVVFIDEFENSLGINCIDILSSNVSTDVKTQFILTSHHPYIIGKISMDNWKVVTRRGSKIIVRNSGEYDLGKSKHRAFTQLINLSAYREGREPY